jgi:CDP-diacylglycerol--glycerol-3-phosphate 3-phosphatidyltransferase
MDRCPPCPAHRAQPPDRDTYFARWSALHGGYRPRDSRVVSLWLTLTYRLARPIARAGVPPDLLTAAGVLVSAAAVGLAAPAGHWPLAAAAAVALSGLLDTLDGAVAVLRDRATPWGYVLDSVGDRISDACHLLALVAGGASPPVCLAGGLLTFLQEYARARAAAIGVTDVAVVTVWERGTRVAVTAVCLGAAGALASPSGAVLGGWTWLGLGAVGCLQLLVVVRRRLRS